MRKGNPVWDMTKERIRRIERSKLSLIIPRRTKTLIELNVGEA